MRICDLTFAYTGTSGGIRTYLEQKRRYLLERTNHEHVLIIPAEETSVERQGRTITYRLASPLLPGCEPYRFFCRPGPLIRALREAKPDVVELGSFFLEPWAALRWQQTLPAGKRGIVAGYFHTDLANAYFGEPVRQALQAHLTNWSELAEGWGAKIAAAVQSGATSYFGAMFRKCDLMFAATPRLRDYGVADALLVPLGVDCEQFHPRRRSAEIRAQIGAGANSVVLVYAGRLDAEKQVPMLVDALTQSRLPDVKLVLVGEGPLRESLEAQARTMPGLYVRPFEQDRDALAEMLASCDIYVSAGPHETCGLSVIEAQASGLPVVGVAAGALVERVIDGTGLLGPVGDAAAMARSIEKVAEIRATMGAAARRHVEFGGCNWSRTFELLIHAYEHAMRRTTDVERARAGAEELKGVGSPSMCRRVEADS